LERVIGFEPTTLCLAIVKRGISPISVGALDSGKSVFLQIFLIFGASVGALSSAVNICQGYLQFSLQSFCDTGSIRSLRDRVARMSLRLYVVLIHHDAGHARRNQEIVIFAVLLSGNVTGDVCPRSNARLSGFLGRRRPKSFICTELTDRLHPFGPFALTPGARRTASR
jgi:hypothetical protein